MYNLLPHHLKKQNKNRNTQNPKTSGRVFMYVNVDTCLCPSNCVEVREQPLSVLAFYLVLRHSFLLFLLVFHHCWSKRDSPISP